LSVRRYAPYATFPSSAASLKLVSIVPLRGMHDATVTRGATSISGCFGSDEGAALASTRTDAGCRVGRIDRMPIVRESGGDPEAYSA